MMRKSLLFLSLLCLGLFAACIKDLESESIYETTTCIGTVMDQSTHQPLSNIRVTITNGKEVPEKTTTRPDGSFSIPVTIDQIGNGYYLKVEPDSLYEATTLSLQGRGWGAESYNLGTIYLAGPEVPQVLTTSVSDVLAASAHAYAKVVNEGKSAVVERGFVFSTMQYPTINDTKETVGSGLGDYDVVLSSLQPNTTYHVRAFARNGVGVAYGEQLSFSTLDGLPTVSTRSVSNVTAISAVSGGEVTADGGFAVTVKGVCWSTTMQPSISNNHTSDGSGLGEFVSNVGGLQPGTTYFLRAYAKNAAGVAYGEQVSFTTPDGLPSVSTSNATNITATTAISGGVVNSDGGFTITSRGVCYSTTPNPTIAGMHTSDGAGTGSFVSHLTNLTPHTTYYVRAYATNGVGTVYGEEKTFVTE